MGAAQQRKKGTAGSIGKMLLILCNVVLMAGALVFAVSYSTRMRRGQEEMELETFCSTIDSMKQLSVSYLDAERKCVQDWAAYMEAQDMTEDEALDYVRTANTQIDRSANIVDMETYEARSSQTYSDGTDTVSAYQRFAEPGTVFAKNLRRMFNGQTAVLGRYRIYESQIMVISVGVPVRLRQPDGSHKSKLLLRLIPAESMKRVWIFPMEYSAAELGLVTTGGDYVIPSTSMRSQNFLEFVRAYNYADDYNGADVVLEQLAQNESGLMEYKNAKNEDCYWYYCRVDGYQGLVLMGSIPKADLYDQQTDWSIVLVIVGVLALLVLIDGAHILRINRNLRETAKLAEQASEAKTSFLSSMSHDIRTPLNAVLGMTDLAQKHQDDPAYVRQCLEKISVSGSHLLTLVNDVLEISRVESGKIVLNPEPFWLDELVADMENIIRAQAEARGVEFTLNVHAIAHPRLMGDKLRLSQIYLNLLTNAVKYTQPGGHVVLDVSERAAADGRVELCCIVADNGMGMSKEFQKTMYESFARAADSRIDKTQGTGLGLAIAKNLLELMGGSIACESELGKGTTFTTRIVLSAAMADHAAVGRTHGQADRYGSLEGVRLLIAEDNDLNWEIISTMLTEKGIQCTRAENGRACVDLLESSAPGTWEMVLMDIQMPLLNGREAARLLRRSARADLRTIPIAAMTADAFAEDVQSCLDAGMNAHLSKPVDLEKVLAVIWQFCRGSERPAQDRN